MEMVTVTLYDPTDPNGGYVLVGLKNKASRVYGSYTEAQKAADRINRARQRYEALGDLELTYDDTYHSGRGWIDSEDLPVGSPPTLSGGTSKGRGFMTLFQSIGFEDITLREIKEEMSNPDVKEFIRSAAICYPDEYIRKAISQYFFVSSE